MITKRRKITNIGGTKLVSLPKDLVTSNEVTYAVDGLMLLDPRGNLSESQLAELLQNIQDTIFRKQEENNSP